MDADLRNPRVHKLFGLEGKSGLAGVLEGKDTLDGATRTTPVDNLWIVPCGRRAENPADLLTARGFAELLDVVRAKYDMVILDSPPLLAVTDPAVIAPRVDTVVLVTRLRNDARKSAACALEILASLGANVLGIVVNGVRSTRVYGYRYGKYAYAHRYDYQRRYGSPDSDVEPLEADSRGLETLG
jgi:capsular exopolysaccharide synthesis family protein